MAGVRFFGDKSKVLVGRRGGGGGRHRSSKNFPGVGKISVVLELLREPLAIVSFYANAFEARPFKSISEEVGVIHSTHVNMLYRLHF